MSRFASDHLETLLAAVDTGSFDGAARALSITPSAVSQRVKAMEQLAGRVLLQRSAPIRPTAAGETVLRLARQVRLLDDEAARELDGDAATAVPVLALAVNADSLGTWFLDALVAVTQRTEVVFDLHREDQDRTAVLLRDGTVVAAVTAERKPVQGCLAVPLGVDRYLAVASPAFVAARLPGARSDRRPSTGSTAFRSSTSIARTTCSRASCGGCSAMRRGRRATSCRRPPTSRGRSSSGSAGACCRRPRRCPRWRTGGSSS